jgi:hypothetical protein
MMCDRYWRDGIVLVERGLGDPHRDGCVDCTRAHASRQELVELLPLIGASYTGNPRWQANVWRRIDGERVQAPGRWRWQLGGALALTCVVALWIGLGRRDHAAPQYDLIRGAVAMRSSSTDEGHVGDRLRVTVGDRTDVWIYRDEHIVLLCRARQASDGCKPDAHGMVVELLLSIPDKYVVIVVDAPVAPPSGKLDEDRAALETAGIHPEPHPVVVR